MSRAIRTETAETRASTGDDPPTAANVERTLLRAGLYVALACGLAVAGAAREAEASNAAAIVAVVALAGLACSARVRD